MPLISAPATAPLITPADAGALNAELSGEPDSRFMLLPRLLRRAGFYHHRAARAVAALIPASAPEVAAALAALPALEPRARGTQRLDVRVEVPTDETGRVIETPVEVQQGRLGDCWFIAALAACEHTWPGFTASLIDRLSNGLIQVRLHTGLQPRAVTISTFVPARHRTGDSRGRANLASLIEKATAVTFGRGSYTGIEHGFAGNAFYLLTGQVTPARPVPRLATVQSWLDAGRPVVASTLLRCQSARLIPREDDPQRHIAVMNGHVYVVCGIARVDEDGRPLPDGAGPLRIHLRNPLGGADPRPGSRHPRRTDLYLSEAQFRRIFLSVNVGPSLTAAG
ncbi:hypothetical protein F7P83_01510 [Brevibacterium luteolum]|nr:hypothetical protein [Brevibacterium luteolum]